MIFIKFILLLTINTGLVSCAYHKDSRSIRIKNDSSGSVEIFWINGQTNELVPQFKRPLLTGYSDNLNSYAGHSFFVKQKPNINCDPDKDAEYGEISHEGRFTVGHSESQVFTIKDGLIITRSDTETKAKDQSEEYMETCLSYAVKSNGEHDYDKFAHCLENKVVDKLWKENYDEFIYQLNLNDRMSKDLKYYACKNRNVIKRNPENDNYYEWSHASDNYDEKDVDVMFENENAKILVVEDFISEEECENIQDKASDFINSDKAATELTNLDDKLSARIHAFARDATGFQFDTKKQDALTLFRKTHVNDFIYDPKCDGECEGKKYNPNSSEKVASMIIYCDVPEDGGYSMNFNKAQVYIDAQPGMAIFYSYVAQDFTSDFGFTEHTECPLKEGEIIGIKHSFRPSFGK